MASTRSKGELENPVATISATPDANAAPPARPPQPEPVAAKGPPAIQPQVDLRLVIELDEASGSYVYKTIDRRTGEVVSQFPREEILHLREEGKYAAGDVIRAKA
jgi:flagellar protein FlaG